MLRDLLNLAVISDFVSKSAIKKGYDYQAEKRVSDLRVDDTSTTSGAEVLGSGTTYDVRVRLNIAGNSIAAINGRCTCPVGQNCKHVVATLLEALARERAWSAAGTPAAPRAPAVRKPTPPPAPVLSPEIAAWLEQIGETVRGDDYPAGVTQRLLYLLQSNQATRFWPQLAVMLVSVRRLKDGAFSDNVSVVKPSSQDGIRPPKFYRDADIGIIARLARERGTSSYDGIRPLQSVELLQRIVATGRAFWRSNQGPPLAWGEARAGRIDWRLQSQAGVSPVLGVDGMLALNAEPPVYVDVDAGVIGPVELGMNPRLAFRLLAAPPIAPAAVADAARALGARLPELRADLLPTPPELAAVIDEEPVPVLRLGSAALAYGYGPEGGLLTVANLGFRYGPVELPLVADAPVADAVRDGRLYQIRRRPDRERAALQQIRDRGFSDARRRYTLAGLANAQALILDRSERWLEFLFRVAGELRQQGFEIIVADDFPYRLVEPSGAIDADFESSGVDWFELRLGVDVDGERLDLARLLGALVSSPAFDLKGFEKLAETDDPLLLSLADGRILALAARRFLPLILALHAMGLSGIDFGGAGAIKLTRAGIVPLLAFETADLTFRGADHLRRLAELVQSRGVTTPALPDSFKAELRPYQAEGLAWLDLLRESGLGGILADDMGLGKTVQLLALLALEKERGAAKTPTLVVAPTSLMGNWQNEARKFAPELNVLVLHGAARKQSFAAIGDHDVVLTTYPLIARDHETLLARDWHMAILDEAQTIKNPNAATTRWLSGIKASHRFCLTGTPMENHLGELQSLMNFANPGFLGDKTAFSRAWRNPIEKHGDVMRAKALARRVKPFLLRRTKAEVATELPPKSEIVESITLEGSQRDLYDSIRLAMSVEVRQAIQERGLARSHILLLQALLKLRQACCDPALLKLGGGIAHPSAKLDRLMEMVTELLSEGRKIIIFSQFTSMLALIEARLDATKTAYSLLTGSTRDRPAQIDAFQQGERDIFLISLKAGGVGLNLTAADTVIVYDPWWNPAVEEQAIDRAYRIGQDKAVFVYRLVATATIEEKMDELKARKRALADGLFDPEGRLGAALTEADVAALFEG